MNAEPSADQLMPGMPAKPLVPMVFLKRTLFFIMIWAGLYFFMLVFGSSMVVFV